MSILNFLYLCAFAEALSLRKAASACKVSVSVAHEKQEFTS